MPRFGNAISREFFDYFDKYCQTATKAIVIQSVDYKALANWTYSFGETTTEVEVRPSIEVAIPFNTLFPYMQKLSVVKLLEANVQHYAHLTGCSTQSRYGDEANPLVQDFIRLNPQLSQIHTALLFRQHITISYMEYLNEMLPNLETLSFQIAIYLPVIVPEQRIVRFKGVKELTVDIYNKYTFNSYLQPIENIQFDQLNTLKLVVFPIVFADDHFIEIIGMNKGLSKIETSVRMTHQLFNGLLQALPQLEEILIHWHHDMRDTLASFFNDSHGLRRFNINHSGFPINIDDIKQYIPPNWEIIPNEMPYMDIFSFVRRN